MRLKSIARWGPRIAAGTRRRCAIASALASLLFGLCGCSEGVLDPRGPVGAANAKILLNAVGIMLIIVVPTIVAALVFAWWFRASNTRATYRPQFVYSGEIELVVWGIPVLVILFLGGVIWIGSHELDPARPLASSGKPIEVQVVSLDWKWLFIYPEQNIASVNQLTVPVGTPLHLSLTSASVMNLFFVPRLGSMIATMNGMVTQLHLQADEAGDYHGLSAQFSGDGFSDMNFVLRAVPQDQFGAWVSGAQQTGGQLDRPAYLTLARQSQKVQPFTYRAVDPALFNAVATQQLPPGPGPQVGRGRPAIHPRPEH
jgi:cytochrome o ubiquinol oxidase subunit 2